MEIVKTCGAECCFCTEKKPGRMLVMVLSNAHEDEGEQFLFCHARCLKIPLRKNIPFIFDEE